LQYGIVIKVGSFYGLEAMETELKLEVIRDIHLSDEQLSAIHTLCNRAYEEDLISLFKTFTDSTHVLGYLEETLVSHAMWVTRWLQPGDGPTLRTAYVEMVATEPNFQRRGFASAIMTRLAEAISDFELGGLCPAEPELYAKLGWVYWYGPLFIRRLEGLILTPDEKVMILRLPKTPSLDLNLPLSAEWREGEVW
jgi:aminoglycoside 2'-N-acetyltransferase I